MWGIQESGHHTKLKGEELYLEFRPEQEVDYSIGQLVIKFKE